MKAIICDWCDARILPGQPFIEETIQVHVMVSDGPMEVGEPTNNHYHDGPVDQSETRPEHQFAPPCYWNHRQ